MLDWKKRKTKLIGLAVGLALVGGIGGKVYADKAHAKKVEVAQATLQEVDRQERALSQQIAELYTGDDQTFLKAEVTADQIASLFDQFDQLAQQVATIAIKDKAVSLPLKDKQAKLGEVKSQLTELDHRFSLTSQTNDLFLEPVLVNDQVNLDQAIQEDVKQETFDKLAKSKLAEEDGLHQHMQQAIQEAQVQWEHIQDATSKVEALFDEDKPKDEVTDDQIKEAREAVDSIKNEAMKERLNEQIQQVEDHLKAKAKEVAQKEAEEQAKKLGGKVVEKEDGTIVVEAQGQTYTASSQPTNSSPQVQWSAPASPAQPAPQPSGGQVSTPSQPTPQPQPQQEAPAVGHVAPDIGEVIVLQEVGRTYDSPVNGGISITYEQIND